LNQTHSPAELRIRGVGKRFGEVVALDRVSLDVARGELLTILGPSGSGKTTLLKVVAGFEAPDGGSVEVGGADITALPPAHFSQKLFTSASFCSGRVQKGRPRSVSSSFCSV